MFEWESLRIPQEELKDETVDKDVRTKNSKMDNPFYNNSHCKAGMVKPVHVCVYDFACAFLLVH